MAAAPPARGCEGRTPHAYIVVLVAAASSLKRNALRLLHVPSRTVFSNWPTSKTPLHYVHSLAFSPSSDMLAVGNARGRVLLYRLKHYSRDG